jgi:hypothetical protein
VDECKPLAYGRRHSSLLLLVADGGSCVTVGSEIEILGRLNLGGLFS